MQPGFFFLKEIFFSAVVFETVNMQTSPLWHYKGLLSHYKNMSMQYTEILKL